MQEWMELLSGDPLPWLLESDPENPGVRYFTLTELLDRPEDDPEVLDAQRAVMSTGPVPRILEAQEPEGYWMKPGSGYGPKYRGTVWSVIMLAQLGAGGDDPRVRRAADYLLNHAIASTGAFSVNGTPSAAILCLGGNLGAALLDLGWLGDERLDRALDWLARAVTGQGIAPAEKQDAPLRYYKSGTSGPGFRCTANNNLPCAWGAVKVMLALGKVPEAARTPVIRAAIETGVEFLFSRDPAVADYPMGWATKPSGSWFQFGFPVFYVTDVLQNLEALAALGHGADPRLAAAVDLVLSKQDEDGRWAMKYTYNGKTWVDIERKGQPSKWVTLRALRVLRQRGVARE
ncbi:MAG: nitrogen fixation protein NifH [Chloroflexi bacterium]|nr:nitrogen fixation protein NifH [Chloroflexota bacterium]